MLFMIVEKFKSRDAVPVYRRFRDHGRLASEGLTYVSSWVDEKGKPVHPVLQELKPFEGCQAESPANQGQIDAVGRLFRTL
jgi:hypothetical protein